jgi:cardiolipin synthase
MDQILAFWPYVVTLLSVLFSLLATGHAILSKRDTRAAIGWVGVIWLAPLLGVLLYVWLGINRIERRARSLRAERPRSDSSPDLGQCPAEVPDQAGTLAGMPLQPLVQLVRDVTRRPLLAGNRVTPLISGDQAYPAMLQAMDEAVRSITLTTYIFDHDPAGQRFQDALRRAISRHVEVRVLIDNVGTPLGGFSTRILGATARSSWWTAGSDSPAASISMRATAWSANPAIPSRTCTFALPGPW